MWLKVIFSFSFHITLFLTRANDANGLVHISNGGTHCVGKVMPMYATHSLLFHLPSMFWGCYAEPVPSCRSAVLSPLVSSSRFRLVKYGDESGNYCGRDDREREANMGFEFKSQVVTQLEKKPPAGEDSRFS